MVHAGWKKQMSVSSHQDLVDAVREGAAIAVKFPSFHGPISGVCLDVDVTPQGAVECETEVWCNNSDNSDFPARHGHQVYLHSSGHISYAVIIHNDRGEKKIVGVGGSENSIAWYVK